MTPEKEAIIRSLKKYFQITELVCPDVYKRFNERAWQFFTIDALYGLLLLRETILCRPMYLNNYKKGINRTAYLRKPWPRESIPITLPLSRNRARW